MFSVEVERKSGDVDLDKILGPFEDSFEVFYNAIHAVFIEFGTEPHFPPVDKIEAWARRKLGLSPKEVRKAAWAIASSMSRHGTDPQPFLRPAVEDARGQASKIFEKGGIEDLADFILQSSQNIIVRKGLSDEGTLLASGGVRRTARPLAVTGVSRAV